MRNKTQTDDSAEKITNFLFRFAHSPFIELKHGILMANKEESFRKKNKSYDRTPLD
jgi:hypothetical protein